MSEPKKHQHIKVYVRIRPLNDQEVKKSPRKCLQRLSSKELMVIYPEKRKYICDGVFDVSATQGDIFETVCKPMVPEVLAGYNHTLFAYGQTGSGKTYTLCGMNEKTSSLNTDYYSNENNGLIFRFVNTLFEELHVQRLEHTIRVSFLELYNEEIIDLLAPSDNKVKIRLFDDVKQKGLVTVHGIEENLVKNKRELYDCLQAGFAKKQVTATSMNAHSSRSHTIFTITLHIREPTETAEEVMRIGKINFVDLAGSENIGKSGAVSKAAREAGSINVSLLSLKRCITALVEKSSHVPYRESKLTRILQGSLGGTTLTSIIGTIAPTSCNSEETLSTLDYINKAKNIVTSPEVNKRITKEALVDQYNKEIVKLQQQLRESHLGQGIYMDEVNYNKFIRETEESKQELSTQILAVRDLEERIKSMEHQLELINANFAECKANLDKDYESVKENEQLLSVKQKDYEAKSENITKYLLKEQVVKEQAEELATVAESTLKNENILHSKVESIYEAAGNNRKVIEELIIAFLRQKNDVTVRLSDVFVTTRESVKNIEEQFAKNKRTQDKYIEELQSNVRSFRARCAEIVAIVSKPMENNKENLESKLTSSQDNMIKDIKFDSSELYSKHLPEVEKAYKKFSNEYMQSIKNIAQSIQEVAHCNRNTLESIEKDSREVYETGLVILNQMDKTLENQQTNVASMRESHQVAKMEIIKKLDAVENMLADVVKASSEHFKGVNVTLTEQAGMNEKLLLLREQFTNTMIQSDEMVRAKVKTYQEEQGELRARLKTDQDASQDNNVKTALKLKENIEKTCEVAENVKLKSLSRIQSEEKNMKTMVDLYRNEVLDSVESRNNELCNKLEDVLETVGLVKDAQAEWAFTMDSAKMNEIIELQKLEELHLESNEFTEESNENIETHVNFVAAEYKNLEHQGDTPAKKTRSYPQKIITNTPKRILEIKRENF